MLKNIAAILGFFLLVLLITLGVQNSKGSSAKSTRLPCHTQVVLFEKVYDPSVLESVQHALEEQNYTIESTIKKAHYMKSQLFEYVDIKKVDQDVKDAIASYQTANIGNSEPVTIKYLIYENDKKDPGKKTQKSKLYAGYMKFDVVYKKKRVYAVQIDFMDMEGKDIPQRVNCAIRSIMTVEP